MSTHLLRARNADRVVLETLRRRRKRFSEVIAFMNGAGLVCIGLLAAAVYELLI